MRLGKLKSLCHPAKELLFSLELVTRRHNQSLQSLNWLSISKHSNFLLFASQGNNPAVPPMPHLQLTTVNKSQNQTIKAIFLTILNTISVHQNIMFQDENKIYSSEVAWINTLHFFHSSLLLHARPTCGVVEIYVCFANYSIQTYVWNQISHLVMKMWLFSD